MTKTFDLPPLAVRLGQLATAGSIVTYVTPVERHVFRVLDAPALPTDRGLRVEVAAPSLFVRIYVPLASKPGPQEARGMAGGVYDSRALKALEGLEWTDQPAEVWQAKAGLHVDAPLLGEGLVIPTAGHTRVARFPTYDPEARLAAEEYHRDRFREDVIGAMKPGEKARLPGTTFAALAVLDKVSPTCVKVERYEDAMVWSGQWNGLGVDVLLPYVPRMP